VNNGIDEDCDGMDLLTSVEAVDNSDVYIYPNPANRFLYIVGENKILDRITIYGYKGNLISSIEYKESLIDVSHLPTGLYFIVLETKKEQRNFKFLKQ